MERRVGSSFSKRLTKCEGLPLPGMVVGGLLSRKEKKKSHHDRKYLKSWMAVWQRSSYKGGEKKPWRMVPEINYLKELICRSMIQVGNKSSSSGAIV